LLAATAEEERRGAASCCLLRKGEREGETDVLIDGLFIDAISEGKVGERIQ
jgi:hypothetical protein